MSGPNVVFLVTKHRCRPVNRLNTGIGGNKVMDLEARGDGAVPVAAGTAPSVLGVVGGARSRGASRRRGHFTSTAVQAASTALVSWLSVPYSSPAALTVPLRAPA